MTPCSTLRPTVNADPLERPAHRRSGQAPRHPGTPRSGPVVSAFALAVNILSPSTRCSSNDDHLAAVQRRHKQDVVAALNFVCLLALKFPVCIVDQD